MAKRRLIFVDHASGLELVLPVTPSSYEWEAGISVETLTIDGLGDLNMGGYKKLDNRSIECLFPAVDYQFNEPETVLDPYYYLDHFTAWSLNRTPVQYMIPGTRINHTVLIESIKHGEYDGTNDVTAKITLREYVIPEVLTEIEDEAVALSARPDDTAATSTATYTVVKGDTLSSIAKKFYGNASLYGKLATANGIKNPNLITVGQVLTIPDATTLSGYTSTAATATTKTTATTTKTTTSKSQAAAANTVSTYSPETKSWSQKLADWSFVS